MNWRLLKAILFQFSGTVGAGIFVLPLIFRQSSFIFSTLCLVVLVGVMVLLNLSYAQVILHTKGDHQLSGYVHRYLGTKYKYLATLNVLFLGLGALIAYLHLAQSFILILVPFIAPTLATAVFITLVLVFHIDGFKPQESIVNLLPYVAIFLVFLLFVSSLLGPSSTIPVTSPSLLVFGPLVFALSGFTIVPEVEESLRRSGKKKRDMVIAIVAGMTLVGLLYFCFTYAVISLSGGRLSADSVTGIFSVSPLLGTIIAIFGLVTIFRASLNFLFVFKEIFYRDFNFSKSHAYTISTISPFVAYSVSHFPFISAISFVGTCSTLVAASLICAMLYKVRPKASTIIASVTVLSIFIFGFVLEIIHLS